MKKITIFVRGENNRQLQSIEIDENTLVKDIIIEAGDEKIHIFLEDKDDILRKDHGCKEAGIQHGDTVHCSSCEDVKVILEYNNRKEVLNTSPGTTVGKILSLVPTVFKDIPPADAADLLIQLQDKTILAATDHIGTYVRFPHCEIAVLLIHNPQIKGWHSMR